jgi:hypothetical protein
MSLLLRPLFEKTSSTCTYLLADMQTLDAIIIDAVDETLVYPHDYGGRTVSSIWKEKQFNEMIGVNVGKQAFIRRINAMVLDLPKKIHVAVSCA